MLLQWAEPADRYYETGIDRVVLFVEGQNGVAWSGVTEISEIPSGGEPEPRYIDGLKIQTRAGLEEFRGRIEAFYSPEAFDICDGSLEVASGVQVRQQERKAFALSFRTKLVNAEDPSIPRHKIHIVYDAIATPSVRNYQTVGDSLEPITLSWDFTTRPKPYPELLPTAHISIDTGQTDPLIVNVIEGFLYGSDANESTLLLPEDIFALFDGLVVTDLGEGLFDVTGPTKYVELVATETYLVTCTVLTPPTLDDTFVFFSGIGAYGLVVTDLGEGLFDVTGPAEHVELVATETYLVAGGIPYEAEVATISSS